LACAYCVADEFGVDAAPGGEFRLFAPASDQNVGGAAKGAAPLQFLIVFQIKPRSHAFDCLLLFIARTASGFRSGLRFG
jgi:hypothetical protein